MKNVLHAERLDDRYCSDRFQSDSEFSRSMRKIRDVRWLRRREKRVRKMARRMRRMLAEV